jgi:hypothetical protein
LQELRRYSQEKQKKQDRAGNMFNKRRQKAGILNTKNKEIVIVDWCYGFTDENIRVNFGD